MSNMVMYLQHGFPRVPRGVRFAIAAFASVALAAVACSPSEGAGGWN